ncbi:methyl-accepting chemotaxis protein [Cohnella endophytica]|uniref:Methyl-accepting chemotaxis protein n=1 Tax=Cohnella endophytica TaxID=2419778 RepID=A0A494XWV6_9BACL|nr:methyl-accepting chemotaxis protein [Cohnella endophytica]RKP55077.1 methyl-accepting chemotaxis protein [Cohnella endophytica]
MLMFRSVSAKLFILFFVSTFVSVLLVGLISYNKSQSIIERKMESVSQLTVKEASEKIGLMLKQFEDMSLQFSTSRDLQDQLSSVFDPSADPADQMKAKMAIQETLNQIARTNTFIKSITLFNTLNETDTISSVSTGLTQIDRKSEWYNKVVGMKGTALWLPMADNGYTGLAKGNLFALSRMINKSLILFEIDATLLSQTLDTIHFSESSKMMLIDDKGQVLLSSAPADAGLKFSVEAESEANLVVSEPLKKTNWSLTGIAPLKELVADTKVIRNLTYWMCAIAAIVAIGIGYLVVLYIGKPLLKIRNRLNEGARGNLDVRMQLNRKDEIGEVASSFDTMMQQMKRLIEQTRISAHKVLNTSSTLLHVSQNTANSSDEISTATGEIAQGSTQLAAEADQVSHIVESMNADLSSVVTATDEINVSSLEVRSASSEGKQFMSDVVELTLESEASIDLLVSRVAKLEQSTEAMQRVFGMMNKITKDSKILSLNAGIEAARFGQMSGGFKVIAKEMGQLSDQTHDSLSTVNQMTETIQDEISQTINALKQALPQLQSQIQSVKTANSIFSKVYEKSEAFTHHVDQIKQDVHELESKQRHLNRSIANVSSFSQQASATSEQVAALSTGQLQSSKEVVDIAKELESLSLSLQATLGEFSSSSGK